MKKISGLCLLFVMIVFSSGAQPGGMGDPRARAVSDSLKMIDYNQMLGQLGITSIRQGASGTATAPNAANYDEAKANPYPILPDPLTLKNGKKVTTAKMWWEQRRPEIVEDFDREVYGRIPKVLPKVTWELVSTKDDKNGEFPNAKQIAIEGHSRWGKAALVTMAYDPRMATAYVSSSGEGGAKLHRRNAGEFVENVAANSEYHWVAGNFIKYAGPLTWNDLPVDSHELVAMCGWT